MQANKTTHQSPPKQTKTKQTAQEWAALGDAAQSAAALARAAPWAAVFEEVAAEDDAARPKEQRAGYAGLAFDACLARACAAWQLGDEVGGGGGLVGVRACDVSMHGEFVYVHARLWFICVCFAW
jgi:hypothetical protein